jgi:hypothetical protein
MRAVSWLLPVVFGLCLSSTARGGAWLYPEGKGQLIVTTTFANARGAYDESGQLVRTPAYRKLEAQAYLEHGVTDWLTFLAQGAAMNFQGAPGSGDRLNLLIAEAKAGLPLMTVEPSGPRYEGLGLAAAGARVHLFDAGHYTVAVETSIRAASAEARRFLDMHDATQIDARLLRGRPFTLFGLSGFLDSQLGVRTRGQNGDEVRMDMTAGIRPLERLMLMAQSFSAVAPRGGPSTFMSAQKFQLSAVYELTPAFAVQIGAVAALGGVNAPAERGIVSGLWLRY